MLENDHGSWALNSQWDVPYKQPRECPLGCLLAGCRKERNGESKQMALTGPNTGRNEEA
jgi:hypothetical protein